MAKMYPSKLTEAFSGFNVPAERTVYEKLSRELPGDYHVFHDVNWDDPSLEESKKAGQIDFVIVHQDYGLIALEIKGGRCSYEPDLRAWSSLNRKDNRVEITDPFDQARTASRIIMKLLLKMPKLSDTFIPHHYAAAFPDCTFIKRRDLRGDVKSWQIIDQESFHDLKTSIHRLFTQSFPGEKLSERSGKLILQGVKQIYGDRPLVGKVLAVQRIRDISNKLIRLTEDQLGLLKHLREHLRVVIRGCAGSGKTTLAIHKARMLSEQGKSILFVCFNQPLSWYLKRECQDYENIVVGHFHGLCLKWLEEINKRIEPENSDEWWSETLPNTVADEIDAILHRFDAVIVDEGQDFKDSYWLVLKMLLYEPEKGILYAFVDSNQNIYHISSELSAISSPFNLDQNLRNTDQVFEIVKRACDLPKDIKSSGVSGPKVEFLEYSDNSHMILLIEKIIGKLISDHLTSKDIVILGTKSQKRTSLKYGKKIGPFTLAEQHGTARDLVTMTVQRYKGLESPVIILCELDDELKHNVKEILYVGMTRSTGMLIVLSQKTYLDNLGL